MSDNLKIWDELKAVPSEAKKTIFGGRLKGMTDINPQWRLQIMTEQFGPIGVGWYYEIIRTWKEEYIDQVSVYVEINLYLRVKNAVNESDIWSKPIYGVGGSFLVAKEKAGPFHSDEAYKMATTDALSVAMKQLGVAADVYMGLSDSKYDKPVENAQQTQEKPREIKQADNKQRSFLKDYLSKFKDKNDVKAIDYINEALVNPNLTEIEANTIINHCKTKLGE